MEEHPQARTIIDTLNKHGHVAYYAGGWVRDFLLKHPSDDIDIATSAPPEVVQNLFEKTVPIGLSFGIILVIIEDRQYEVATFRQDLEYKDGRKPSKISFTTAEEDASRRDFTINGMFYDPIKQRVIDFVQGQQDLQKGIIRAIGNPHERFKEDRLRMIRAVRLACRFQFTIEKETQKAIYAHATELFPSVSVERVWQEFEKMSAFAHFRVGLIMMHHFGLLSTIFPEMAAFSKEEIEKKLQPLENFPDKTPTVAYVLELFQEESLEKKKAVCEKMKLSNKEKEFVIFQHDTEKMFIKDPISISRYSWAHFYAHPFSQKCLWIHAARLPAEKRILFLEQNENRKAFLSKEIARIENKTPVVTSAFLKKQGISPGISMGRLLQEAETLAINQKLEDPKAILPFLKKSPYWPS